MRKGKSKVGGNEVRTGWKEFKELKAFCDLCAAQVLDGNRHGGFLRREWIDAVIEQLDEMGKVVTYTQFKNKLDQHSGEIVHRHVATVVTLLATVMAPDIIKPADPTFRTVPSHIQESDRYWPHFKGCIGAINGVHVPVVLPLEKQHPYRGRKRATTVNCMCACDFDMKFTFACVGWEGSAHDTRIFLNCLNNESDNFPKPPPGYPMKRGFLAPYKGERYHIPYFQKGSQLHRLEERFNYLHSSLRSIIERTFGVWKNRWKILRSMPAFHIRTQNYIIVATIVLHNFIRAHDHNDVEHRHSARGTYGSSEGGHYDRVVDVVSYLDEIEMKEVRNNIIASIC